MTDSPFAIRGVVEGFYGVFYTAPQRDDLIRFLGRHGFNTYLYGPKNDRRHRARWRDPYPARALRQFAHSVSVAHESGVTFAYAIAPGVSITYASPKDFALLTAKLFSLYECGVRDFSLFLDDIDAEFQDPYDAERYSSYAEAHADLANRTKAWLHGLDSRNTLSLCPTDYYGSAPFSDYLQTLGKSLPTSIDVFYTGPEVCSRGISAADAAAFAAVIGRKPLVWDNYPVNDLAMQDELHLGPILGRGVDLGGSVRGLLANPMNQPEASKIPLATLGDYLADPNGYEPERSWLAALREVAGEDESADALRVVAENTRRSCLAASESEALAAVTNGMVEALRQGHRLFDGARTTATVLSAQLSALDEATYHLKFDMANLALRQDLLPWIEVLEHWLWSARRAIEVLRARELGQPVEKPLAQMRETWEAARRSPKHVGARLLEPLLEIANG